MVILRKKKLSIIWSTIVVYLASLAKKWKKCKRYVNLALIDMWGVVFGPTMKKRSPESKYTCQNPKTCPMIQNTFQNQVFWILGSVFGFWELFLDSGKAFLSSNKRCLGLWEVFCPYEPPYWAHKRYHSVFSVTNIVNSNF